VRVEALRDEGCAAFALCFLSRWHTRACVRACAGDGGFQANMYVGLKFGADLVKETKEVCTLSPRFRGSLQSPIYRFGSIAILNIHFFYSVFSDVDLSHRPDALQTSHSPCMIS
jgi:hypothetical protein